MDDIRRIFDKFTPTTQPEQYKKFNPNPQPEYPVQNITPFPQYEEWKSMIEGGTLPSEFDMRPGEAVPTGMPTETGLPTEAPGELPISEESAQKFLDMISGLSTRQIEELDERGILDIFFPGLAPTEEPTVEEGPVSFLSLVPEEARQKYEAGEMTEDEWKSWVSYQKDIAHLEDFAGEKAKADIQSEITKAIQDGAYYEDIWDFLTNKDTGLGLSNSEASTEIAQWVKENQDIPVRP